MREPRPGKFSRPRSSPLRAESSSRGRSCRLRAKLSRELRARADIAREARRKSHADNPELAGAGGGTPTPARANDVEFEDQQIELHHELLHLMKKPNVLTNFQMAICGTDLSILLNTGFIDRASLAWQMLKLEDTCAKTCGGRAP